MSVWALGSVLEAGNESSLGNSEAVGSGTLSKKGSSSANVSRQPSSVLAFLKVLHFGFEVLCPLKLCWEWGAGLYGIGRR